VLHRHRHPAAHVREDVAEGRELLLVDVAHESRVVPVTGRGRGGG
jgi:hypothetical protein